VVDEACTVAPNSCVAYPPAIHGKAPDLSSLEVGSLALQTLFVIDQLAFVLNNPRVLVDRFESKDAPAVEFRAASDDSRSYEFFGHVKTG
jgi:hypothetical protein